jgi:hypothetical protein
MFIIKRSLFGKTIDYVGYLGLAWLVLLIPLAKILPPQIAWENGILENLQVVILAIGVLMSFRFYKNSFSEKVKAQWLSIAAFFAILIGRELSWGRVFFQTKMTDLGPEFIAMNKVLHHMLMQAIILVLIIGVIFCLIRNIPWGEVIQVPLPVMYIVLLMCNIILALLGDRGLIINDLQGEVVEELSELMVYFLIVKIVYYYSINLKS